MFVDPPGPPEDLQVSDITKSSCNLTWQRPAYPGRVLKGYIIEMKEGPESKEWQRVNDNLVQQLGFRIMDLKQGWCS